METAHLEVFFGNLLLNEKNGLHNRNLHVSRFLNEEKVDVEDVKVDIEDEKVDIEGGKVDIGDVKVDIKGGKVDIGDAKVDVEGEKVDIGDAKVKIEEGKVDIRDQKVDIESVFSEKGRDFYAKATVHIHRLFEKFGFGEVFGRSAVMELLELKGSGTSKFLSNLVKADIIEPVSGYGKGRCKFKNVEKLF